MLHDSKFGIPLVKEDEEEKRGQRGKDMPSPAKEGDYLSNVLRSFPKLVGTLEQLHAA